MNINKIGYLLTGLVFCLALFLPFSAMAIEQGDPLQPFAAKDMDGKKVDLAAIIGKKPVMLVFWASWCPTCKSEVPKVNGLVKKYRAQGMEFIGINVGFNDSEKRARKFMNKNSIKYPVIFDQDGTSRKYGVQSVPTIIIADKNGIVVFKNYGVPDITDELFKQLQGK